MPNYTPSNHFIYLLIISYHYFYYHNISIFLGAKLSWFISESTPGSFSFRQISESSSVWNLWIQATLEWAQIPTPWSQLPERRGTYLTCSVGVGRSTGLWVPRALLSNLNSETYCVTLGKLFNLFRQTFVKWESTLLFLGQLKEIKCVNVPGGKLIPKWFASIFILTWKLAAGI